MRVTISALWLLSLLLLIALPGPSQEPKPQDYSTPRPEPDSFYSGTILEVDQEKVVVSRTILGKPPEKRAFAINGETKVEGKMKPKSRVTVRFATTEQGDVALAILVRDKEKNEKKK